MGPYSVTASISLLDPQTSAMPAGQLNSFTDLRRSLQRSVTTGRLSRPFRLGATPNQVPHKKDKPEACIWYRDPHIAYLVVLDMLPSQAWLTCSGRTRPVGIKGGYLQCDPLRRRGNASVVHDISMIHFAPSPSVAKKATSKGLNATHIITSRGNSHKATHVSF